MKTLPGFTLLELMMVIALIALTSTIVLTNSSFLDRYDADNIPTYENFLQFLSEESALKKKKVAWFIGNQEQSAQVFQRNEWHHLDLDEDLFPIINLDVVFKDSTDTPFTINDERSDPFVTFDPMGRSSGASIEFYNQDVAMVLLIDQFSQITFKNLE